MDLVLNGKRALVTGASSGIGKGCAAALAREGAAVFICARGKKRLEEAAAEIGAAGFLACDLFIAQDAEKLETEAASALGGLDILVTNTPNPDPGPFERKSDSDWQKNHE